jgi:nicotinamidase-related amidase
VVAKSVTASGNEAKAAFSKPLPPVHNHVATRIRKISLMADPQSTALIVVDVQRAFDEWEASGKRRNNPDAVARISELLAAFRDRRAPIFHIRHEGTKPTSSFLHVSSVASPSSSSASTAPSSAPIWKAACVRRASRPW